MSAQGRGRDSTLVHMTPREVSGLQSLAMAHGGTLTINPETGLPEAGFLDSILPTLLGGAATFFSGGTITPFMAALGVGGLTALTSKDLGKGLMAGLGAYGGAGIAGGLMNFGEAAIGAEAAKGALPSGIDPLSEQAASYEIGQAAANKAARAGATNFDRLSRGVTEGFKNPMGAFSAIGGGSKLQGAAMLGAPLLSALATQDQTSVPTAEQIKFDPRYANINISRSQRPYQPDTGSSGERRYFGNTNVTQYGAEGGFVSNDGIQHFAYGGGTIDPTYDYSGYGPRSNSSGMRPITSVEAPKPDFVGADGKTYRYDPIKKSWYVIKEAEKAKVNAGVETLMDGAGGGQDKAPSPFNPIKDNGLFASIWGRTTQDAAPVVDKSTFTQAALNERTAQQLTPTDEQDSSRDDVSGMNPNPLGGDVTSTPAGFANPLGGDVISTPTGSSALSGGIASLGGGSIDAVKNAIAQNISNAKMEAAAIADTDTDTEADQERNQAAAAYAIAAQAQRNQMDAQTEQDAAIQSRADREARSLANARDVNYKALSDDMAALVSELSDNPNDNPGRAPSLGTGTTAGWGGSDIGGSDLGGYDGGGDPGADGVGARANGGMVGHYAQGGLGSLGGYSDGGRLLRGPGDGVSDSIPATVGNRQPARLADGEFVVPARIVSELGNGSTEAGARALYKMMDRIQANRRKTTGKNSVAVNSKSHKYLPA